MGKIEESKYNCPGDCILKGVKCPIGVKCPPLLVRNERIKKCPYYANSSQLEPKPIAYEELIEKLAKLPMIRTCVGCLYWKTCPIASTQNDPLSKMLCKVDADPIRALIKEALPELAKEAGYVLLAEVIGWLESHRARTEPPNGIYILPLSDVKKLKSGVIPEPQKGIVFRQAGGK